MAQIEAAVPQIGVTGGRDVGGEPVPHSARPPTELPRRACDRADVAVYFFERVPRIVGNTQREAGRGRCPQPLRDRKSTRLNSSHEWSSYAVFCLTKKR